MSYNRDNFKISFKSHRTVNSGNINANFNITDRLNDTKFYVNEKKGTVVCVLEGFLNVPTNANDILYLPEIIIRGVGVAKCAKDDVFDVERGKRIALAKAENKVYENAMNYISKTTNRLADILSAYSKFCDKGCYTCSHNEDYIDSLSYEAHPNYIKNLKPLKRGK